MESLPRYALIVPLALALSCKSGTPALKPCTADAECGDKGLCGRGGVCFLDEAAPRIIIASPQAKDVVTQGSVTLEGAVSDGQGSGVVRVEYAVNGGAFSDAVLADDRFSAPVPLKEEDGAPVVLEVRAADRIGNEGRASVAFLADRVAPRISVVQPPLTAVGKKDVGSTVAVGFRAVDGSGRVAKLEISEDGGATFRPAGEVTREVTLTAKVEDAIESKRFAGVARATDAVGNVSKPIAAAVVLIDTVDPVLTLLSPMDKAVIRAGDPAKVLVQGTVKDSNLVSVWALWSGGTLAVSHDKTGSFSAELPPGNEDGVPHVVQLTAMDAAGNRAQVQRTFTVDRVAPRLTIESPAQDADCTGTGACTGAVFNALANAVVFSGTAEDGGGLAAKGGLVGEIGGVKADPQVTGNRWTFSWTNPPLDNGKLYEFVLTATDSVGNTSVAKRKIFLDRVVPVATALLDQKRLVSRISDVVAFSEPMDRASVAAAIASNGTPLAVRASDSDGKSYGPVSQLEPYTYFELTVGPGAKDRAGNPIGAALKQEFLTEIVPPPTGVVIAKGQSPGLAVDGDGRPLIVYWAMGVGEFKSSRWDGRGAWVSNRIDLGELVDGACGKPDIVLSEAGGPQLGRSVVVQVALCVVRAGRSPAVFFATAGGGLAKWTGEKGGAVDLVGAKAAPVSPSLSVFCLPFAGCFKTVHYLALDVAGMPYLRRVQAQGNGSNPWTAAVSPVTETLAALGGDAVATSKKVLWLPDGDATERPKNFLGISAVIGRNAIRNGGKQLGSAYFFAAGTYTGANAVSLACASNPLQVSSWKEQVFISPARGNTEDLDLTLSDKDLAVAVKTTVNEVAFGTGLNEPCAGSPLSVSWSAPIQDAGSPSVRFGNGRLYKAYANTKLGEILLAP